jgi:hypothetical protein
LSEDVRLNASLPQAMRRIPCSSWRYWTLIGCVCTGSCDNELTSYGTGTGTPDSCQQRGHKQKLWFLRRGRSNIWNETIVSLKQH